MQYWGRYDNPKEELIRCYDIRFLSHHFSHHNVIVTSSGHVIIFICLRFSPFLVSHCLSTILTLNPYFIFLPNRTNAIQACHCRSHLAFKTQDRPMAAPDRTNQTEQFCECSCLQIYGLRPKKSQPPNRIGLGKPVGLLGRSQISQRIVFVFKPSSRWCQLCMREIIQNINLSVIRTRNSPASSRRKHILTIKHPCRTIS